MSDFGCVRLHFAESPPMFIPKQNLTALFSR
jgi:hypothetical protein